MKWWLLMALFFLPGLALAQVPVFKSLRYEDDLGYFRNDSVRDWYSRLKFAPLDSNGNTFVSLGGDVRFQYFYIRNEDWGDAMPDDDGFILTRYLFHSDWHFGTRLRVFTQLQSSNSSGRSNPNTIEENPLDLHQLFVESKWGSVGIRVGRQEMLYGSQRLVAVREFPNSRLAFDAAKLLYENATVKADVFYAHPVVNRPGILDDHFLNEEAKLWGSYATMNAIPVLSNIDLYYLGLWKHHASFNGFSAKETRHTFGLRIWNNRKAFQYDFEAAVQTGKWGNATISAWTIASNTTYVFEDVTFQPRLNLKSEVISGDRKPDDNRQQTFNPLYPRGAYFGSAGIIGPANLFDFHPGIELQLTSKLNVSADYDIFWRMSRGDGIYAPNMHPIYTHESSKKFIGKQLGTTLIYQFNAFVSFKWEGVWFDAGDYLMASGTGKDMLLTAVTTQLRF